MAKVAGVARQAGEVRIEGDLSAQYRLTEHVVVVDHRVDNRLLGLVVVHVDAAVGEGLLGVLALNAEIVAADVEIISLAHARQVDGRGKLQPLQVGNSIVAVERVVGDGIGDSTRRSSLWRC